VSLHRELDDERYLQEAEWVVAEVERVLGRPRGIRIGEEPDRDGQYFHYLAMWMYALLRLGTIKEEYHRKAVELVRQIHPAFVLPGVGVIWKMLEDLSGPYPGYGLGGLDHFHGYVVYSEIDPRELAREIRDMKSLVERSYRDLAITQDLGLGMMLWFTHLRADEPWAGLQQKRCLDTLDQMWVHEPGYFCREPSLRHIKFAFTNYGVSMGLQAVDAWPERIDKLNTFFDGYRSGDEYDRNAITHVMACTSHFPGEFIKEI
ncbi:MAG: hypothetical protein H6Q55_1145, partial [Deltaproteobacteria bacterium]|nr:hypothetical protein [Deltaproteobacteria bacterium]